MTERQQKIFSEVLDLNYEADNEQNAVKKYDKLTELNNKLNELKKDMGEDAYNDFMNKGKQMFS